ncbi:MAG: prephenate dehydrogenase [Halolamina sp.]|uniref:prephenate dehydrogenase n=1 Tax=Halolamina sp. TaxID=1940283 RepID=UPI002FC2A63E
MTLCIVGAGEMGRWFAETTDYTALAFADTDTAAARDAAVAFDAEAIPLTAGTPETHREFETVCLAVPLPVAADAVADWAPYTRNAMLDVSGIMGPLVAAMREHLPDQERASLHPLFAPQRAPGNVALVADAVGPTLDPLLDDLRKAENELFETTPEEHDAAMSTVQAKTHAAVLAWALASDGELREEFHTPVSADLTELAATVTEGDPRVYADIQESFPGADAVAEAAETLADADSAAFTELYSEAATAAEALQPSEGDQ